MPRARGFITYNAVAHPELVRDDQLLLSYSVNGDRRRGPPHRVCAPLRPGAGRLPEGSLANVGRHAQHRGHEVRRHLGRRRRAPQARRAAHRRQSARQGNRVVAVLSARGKTTDELIAMAEEVSPRPDPREMDMLLSTGERMSCALCAMAINDLGHRAISLTGSQAGIVTDTSHTKARILDVRADRIRAGARRGRDRPGRRLSGRLDRARRHHARPRRLGHHRRRAGRRRRRRRVRDLHRRRRRLQRRPADRARRAQAAASSPSRRCSRWRPPAPRSSSCARVEYARNHGVRIHCRSSFDDAPGTVVVSEEETMEHPLITAVTHSTEEARVTLIGVPDTPGVAGRIFGALAAANINVDMIVQNEPETEGARGRHLLHGPARGRPARGARALEADDRRARLDAIADRRRRWARSRSSARACESHPGVAAKVFTTLGDEGINIEMISTSPDQDLLRDPGGQVPRAVRRSTRPSSCGRRDHPVAEEPVRGGRA